MRKILILSREVGYEMEITEVENVPFIPESCFNKKTVEEFFEELKNHDDHFENFAGMRKERGTAQVMATLENGKQE